MRSLYQKLGSTRVIKPLVGISCCRKFFGAFGMVNHAASDTYVRAVDQVVGAVPILLPANGGHADIATLLNRMDGIILTGSRSNVQPSLYKGPPHAEGTPEDEFRDATTLPLIRAAIDRGVPLLAICRGLQEMNVALGGSLHQRLQDLPGRLDHSSAMHANPHFRAAKAHLLHIEPGTWLHQTVGRTELPINSLHNQGIDRLAPTLVAEAHAPDGTIEAVRVPGPGFAVGVQWHPEYDFHSDAASLAIFTAFRDAVRQHATRAYASAAD